VNARAAAALAQALEYLDGVARDEGLLFTGHVTVGALRVFFAADPESGEHAVVGANQ
jgi:hypothetical protein